MSSIYRLRRRNVDPVLQILQDMGIVDGCLSYPSKSNLCSCMYCLNSVILALGIFTTTIGSYLISGGFKEVISILTILPHAQTIDAKRTDISEILPSVNTILRVTTFFGVSLICDAVCGITATFVNSVTGLVVYIGASYVISIISLLVVFKGLSIKDQFDCCGLYDYREFQNLSVYWDREVTCFSRRKFSMLVPIACCRQSDGANKADLTTAQFVDLELCLRTAHISLTLTDPCSTPVEEFFWSSAYTVLGTNAITAICELSITARSVISYFNSKKAEDDLVRLSMIRPVDRRMSPTSVYSENGSRIEHQPSRESSMRSGYHGHVSRSRQEQLSRSPPMLLHLGSGIPALAKPESNSAPPSICHFSATSLLQPDSTDPRMVSLSPNFLAAHRSNPTIHLSTLDNTRVDPNHLL
ncbi:hypothetical protein LSAT2_011476 [Lamellibrachia satsuma]|nr:hypothetical protein LSAT2_011476 [Lamellibrachia satsuma]